MAIIGTAAKSGTDSAESLTIFLAKEGVTEAASLLKSIGGLKQFKIQDGAGELGTLYVQARTARAPRWAKFFAGQVDAKEFGRVASAAAVFIVSLEKWTVLLAFGQGRHMVDLTNIEDRFGRKVSLNSIGQERVRSLDKQNFEAAGRHVRIQSATEASPLDLGLDFDQDFLRTLAGAPVNGDLGRMLSGVDSLRAMVSVGIPALRQLLTVYVKQFNKEAYKKTFPWVDHITDVVAKETVQALNASLLEKIKSCDLERCWLAVPAPIDWGLVLGFRYRRGLKQPILHDIGFSTFLETVDDVAELTVEQLQRRHISCVSSDDVELYSWPAYKCIYCEMDLDGATYLLNDGRWYAIEKDFVKQVDAAVKQIPKYKGVLPEFRDPSEGLYCERVAEASGGELALMDRKLVTIDASPSKVEFCDLYSDKKELIHLKRYGGSAILSHLFAQGTVSAQLFVADAGFRKAVNALLPKTHKLSDSAARPNTDDFTIVFGIISHQSGVAVSLPFFSRLRLKQAARELSSFGYQVALTKIPVSDEFSKTKVYKAVK